MLKPIASTVLACILTVSICWADSKPVIGQLPKFTKGVPAACFLHPREREKATNGRYMTLDPDYTTMIIDGQKRELTGVNPNSKWGSVKYKSGDYDIKVDFRSPLDPYLWMLNRPGKAKLKVTHKGKTTTVKAIYGCVI